MSIELTPAAAVAVLTAASPNMFSIEAIPASDKDKIEEARKILELAVQSKAIADAAGPSKVPLYPKICEVLAAGGIPANGTVVEMAAPPVVPVPAPAEIAPPVAVAPPPAPEPTPEPEPEPVLKQPGERWLDVEGNIWIVKEYGGGPQIEVVYEQTGEVTVLPASFLTRPVPNAVPSPTGPVQPILNPPTAADPAPPQGVTVTQRPDGAAEFRVPTEQPVIQPMAPYVPSPPSAVAPDSVQVDTAPIDDDEGDEEYGNLLEQVTKDYNPIGMPVPLDLEHPPAGMPDDLTSIGDITARALHSQFNALAARMRYLLGLENAKARACTRVRDRYLKAAIREARKEAPKDATLTEVTYIAEVDDVNVATWTERVVRHSDRAEAFKTFLAFYSEDVTVLSRDWTMRQREEEGS